MLTRLYSDGVIAKLKKIPQIVWYLFYGLASLFASAYLLKQVGLDYVEIARQLGLAVAPERLLILFYPMLFVADIVIFEILAYFAHMILIKRFPEMSMSDFVFKLRLTQIIALAAIGVLSLLFFAFPSISSIGATVLNTLIQGVMLGFFLFELSKSYARTPHAAYKYLASIYIGINMIWGAFTLAMLFTSIAQTMDYVDAGIKLALYLPIILLAYVQHKALKKLPPRESKAEPVKDDTVYKDFGF